jgi:transketolase
MDLSLSSMPLDQRSKDLRKVILQTLVDGNRGHLGAAFSLVEIIRVLYDDILQVNPDSKDNIERDRLILSKGHGCLAQYVMLAEKGFFPKEALASFCKDDALLGGHPEHHIPGIEASTGSLGHGLSIGIGMALSAKMDHSKRKVVVIIGDGESNEGTIWEAALHAGKHALENLTVIVDYNKYQSWGATAEILNLEPLADKWRAFGFGVDEVDGHNVEALKAKLKQVPFASGKPNCLIAHTIKGKGCVSTEGNLDYHHVNKFSQSKASLLIKELEQGL